ncbi:CD44 antigen isoform X2 [Myiozetetes cayanensis]|uniref:CD44 antigen isoform X2 n=1 Tax=Myiozetetes cayanensis TaxID=478635 RepID=UPI00216101A1|nr:CD44 antigen isoform X2 [Myiozetetes cayanensis]
MYRPTRGHQKHMEKNSIRTAACKDLWILQNSSKETMANFSLWATFGLCLLKLCLTETQFNVSCRYGGVFHVEKNGRYSLTRPEAVKLCRALNSTLATLEQVKKAHELGFETCRYGFVEGHIVIPRIKPYHLCAANHTGVYKLPANTTGRYDAYCYNETETRDVTCEPVEKLDTSLLSNQDEIVIDNADGSRYNADGTRHTGGESSTSGADDENVGSGSTHETTPMDTSIRRSSPSYYGSATPVSQLPDHTSGGGEKGIPGKDYDDEVPSLSPDISFGTVADDFHEEDGGRYHATTTPGPRHDNLEKSTTQAWWNLFPDHWWWSNPGEKTQEATQATKADVTSSGNGSDDEDSSEEMMYPTLFPGWGRSVAKDETAPSTTPGPRHDNLEKSTTQAWWNLFPDHWWWSNPGEKTQEATQATKADVTSSGNGSDDEDSSEEMMYPTLFPGWGRSVAKDETAPSTTVDSQHETLLEVSTQGHWNPTFTDEEEQYPSSSSRALVTNENEKHQGPTQHPLSHSVHSGGISQEQNPANTTASTEQHQFTVAGENYFEKESSHTAVVSTSVQDPWVYPGWDNREDYATRPAITDRTIPSRENNHEKDSSTTESVEDVNRERATKEPLAAGTPPGRESEQANTTDGSHVSWIPAILPDAEDHLNRLQTPLTTTVASPDDAHHKDPTEAPLPSDNEPGQGTEGIRNPTDTPEDEVLHKTTASIIKDGYDSPLIVTASTDVLVPEDITQETWATRVVVTAVASPDDAHHKDPTEPPLPSDNESGQGSEGITNPTDAPRGEVLHRTTASIIKDESVEDVKQERATKEPLAPGTPPGRESEQANTTDDSHVSWIPAILPDAEDHLNCLQTPLTTSSTSGVYGNEGPHKGHYESTTFPGETATTKIDSQPRSARVPEWLIIVAALVALVLILAVCIAVNSRRRCGQKKKLVINNGKGAVEDRKSSALNGDISKSQEMVHLVHKGQSNDRTQACDELLTVNETQNHQELDMKTGV